MVRIRWGSLIRERQDRVRHLHQARDPPPAMMPWSTSALLHEELRGYRVAGPRVERSRRRKSSTCVGRGIHAPSIDERLLNAGRGDLLDGDREQIPVDHREVGGLPDL